MEQQLEDLKGRLAEVVDLTEAAGLLSWDMQTHMPPTAAAGRSQQRATLGRIIHTRLVSDDLGALLEDLKPHIGSLDPHSNDRRIVEAAERIYRKQTRLPLEWVTEFSQVTAAAHQNWSRARVENDFPAFRPYLERIVELMRSYAGFFAPYEHIYDPLLDNYEPGMKSSELITLFDDLRDQQVDLIREISSHQQIEAAFLHQPFEPQKQWDFGVEVITRLGYQWQSGRQDKAAHPFTIRLGANDVRITTRIDPNYLGSCLFATIHECGHALHGQGIAPELSRTPLGIGIGPGAGGRSAGIGESQSRLYENLVGRSYEFWEFFYPTLQNYFPSQLGNLSLDAFYKGINRVQPSLNRVEADEGTYNLHIMLRLELEIALLEGTLKVKDLPEAWNERMQAYLGLTPPDDAAGVLQDVHWSSGSFGYFPTYALGNLISAQLWERMQSDIPDLQGQIRKGKFESLLGWLRDKIQRHGSKYSQQELMAQTVGEQLQAGPYLRYLKRKFGGVYNL
jgi:carboxypeptidase Taq